MKAIAHLPGLDIEIVHHQSSDGLAEQISINLKAVPSFEAFARFYEAMNPFAFWAEAARLAWLPWVEAMRATTLPQVGAQPPKPRPQLPGSYSEVS
jgi:hypothetical protein